MFSWSYLDHILSDRQSYLADDLTDCHGLCSITFFPKNNQRMAPTESPMMAASPLLSATITTGHLRRTYIRAPSEYFLHSATTNTTCILIIVITNQHQSHRARTSLEVMSRGHHKDLRGFTSASFGTILNTSLLVICSFYYHMLFTITPYMFMFCFSINTPVCCMYFASLNINLATYFSLTRSRLLKLLLSSTPDSPNPSGPSYSVWTLLLCPDLQNLRHPSRERRNLQVEANASHNFGPDISVWIPSLAQMILCFHTFLWHVLDAYFGYYLHALDMCYTWLTPGIHFRCCTSHAHSMFYLWLTCLL